MKETQTIRAALPGLQRIVIKIGSRVLIQRNGRPDLRRMRALVTQIAALHAAGKDVVVVSSGAIGAGLHALGMTTRPDNLPDLQMAAAVGQTRLMTRYSALFSRASCRIGQVLLTHADLRERSRHLNARNTLMNLLRHRIIPIVNENDVVAVDEIKFGDNDHLAALTAMLIDADLLILLSTVDGFRRPVAARKTQRVPHLQEVSDDMLSLARGPDNTFSVGGMRTKLESAHDFVRMGGLAVIANGRKADVIDRIMQGHDEGTLIGTMEAGRRDPSHRKQWIAFFHRAQGAVVIDTGACQALQRKGSSLLPAGIKAVEGSFPIGAVINIKDEQGHVLGRGLTEYASHDLEQIRGCKTDQIAALLGSKDYDEVVHRDHLLVFEPAETGESA
jgi:glutamate 5-kinase